MKQLQFLWFLCAGTQPLRILERNANRRRKFAVWQKITGTDNRGGSTRHSCTEKTSSHVNIPLNNNHTLEYDSVDYEIGTREKADTAQSSHLPHGRNYMNVQQFSPIVSLTSARSNFSIRNLRI